MDLGILLKLLHVGVAFALVAGLVGRWVVLTRASRSTDVEDAAQLAEAASPFERLVKVAGTGVLPLGMLTAWAQGYPWLGLTTGWMLASLALLLPLNLLIPLVFIPRGRVFEQEMANARRQGVVIAGQRAAWNDRAVAFARRLEIGAVALVIALMVLKPF